MGSNLMLASAARAIGLSTQVRKRTGFYQVLFICD